MTPETYLLSLVAAIPLACLLGVVRMLRAERRRADAMVRELEGLADWILIDLGEPPDEPEGQGMPDGESYAWWVHDNAMRDVAAAIRQAADGQARITPT